jgi:CheY-like chemotaxis protein
MALPVILCVDDEKIVTDTLTTQLRSEFGEDYDYEAASDVDEAWELIDDLASDGLPLKLIICDWLMPVHKGDKFLLEVHQKWPQVKLIMLSGHADEDAVERLKNLVKDFKFVRKPWTREEFLPLIRQTLSE